MEKLNNIFFKNKQQLEIISFIYWKNLLMGELPHTRNAELTMAEIHSKQYSL